MIDTYLRSPYQKLLVDPIAKKLSKLNPNLITLIACLTGLSIIPLLYFHHTALALLCLISSGYLDTLDGTLARLNTPSNQGAALDLISDRIVEMAIIFGLFAYAESRALPCLLMLSSILICITSFLVVGIFSENTSEKSFYYSPGLIERTEAFILFGTMIALPTLFLPLALTFATLVFATAGLRTWQFLSH